MLLCLLVLRSPRRSYRVQVHRHIRSQFEAERYFNRCGRTSNELSEPNMNNSAPDASTIDHGDTPNPTQATTMAPQVIESQVMEPQVKKPKAPSARPSMKSRSSMNGPLYMQTSNNKVLIRRVRRKGDGPMRNLARWLLENQTGMSSIDDHVWRLSWILLLSRSLWIFLGALFHDSGTISPVS